MGKRLVIAGFMVSFMLAIYTYVTREAKSLRESLERSGREPRVVMEDFTVNRYRGEMLVGRLTARLGHFYEPNVVELDGEIRGERLTDNGREQISAESATALFTASTLTKMVSEKTEMVRAELTGFVEVGLKGHVVTTDFAEYLHREGLVRSPRPVRVEGPGRVFSGEEGFSYIMSTETLEMNGPVKGVVAVNEAQ